MAAAGHRTPENEEFRQRARRASGQGQPRRAQMRPGKVYGLQAGQARPPGSGSPRLRAAFTEPCLF